MEALGGPLHAVFDACTAINAIEHHKQTVILAGVSNSVSGVFLRNHVENRGLHRQNDAIGDAYSSLDDTHHGARRVDQQKVACIACAVELGDRLLNVADAFK